VSEPYVDVDSSPPQRRSLARKLAFPLIAFGIGMGAMGYGLHQWPRAAHFLGLVDAPQKLGIATGNNRGLPPQFTVTTNAPNVDPEVLHARIQALEERLDRVSAQASATSGNANRAEGMLIAFAARRAIERGVQLGYLESLLRERFGDSQPQAVAAIIAGARARITLDSLSASFEKIAPQLQGDGAKRGMWDNFKHELSALIIIRRGNEPSSRPDEVVERVRGQIADGDINQALIEINRLPERGQALNWITAARHYVQAHNALDRIETAALIDPMGDDYPNVAPVIVAAPTLTPAPSPSSP